MLFRSLEKYGNMTYEEIKEKSHDVAWRNTARDYIINIEAIAREAGLSADDLEYVAEMSNRATCMMC